MTGYSLWPEVGPDQLERDLLARWKEEGLFQRTQEQGRSGPPFVFYEGPPTANGKPGIHHVFSRTIKDLICRFQAMQGKSVTRIAGWDTHGLPVEIEVEKELNLKGKKDIETLGVEKFNHLSRESVLRYKSDWEQLSDRIGYWLDYEHPYITYSNAYIETVWWLLARLHEKNLLYRGHRVLPYCPRCGTVLSSHELALGYEKITDWSVYVTFPLEESRESGVGSLEPPLELLVWTTTPWTLPSNVAAAVNPEMEYGVYRVGDRRMVFATARESALLELKVVSPTGDLPVEQRAVFRGTHLPVDKQGILHGRDLVGKRYRRPLDVVPLPPEGNHSLVIAGDFVRAEEGSGIVHMAPAFGADDYAAARKHGLAVVHPVAPDGTFRGTSWAEIEGKLVTDTETNQLIVDRLKSEGRVLQVSRDYSHDYPFCWRCQSKLIYYSRDSWFVRTSAVKDRMLGFNAQVGWHPPEMGAGRFGEWLENNVDWALSRDRYWGTPLPVWVCSDDAAHVEVIGSYAKLAERWGKPLSADFDPHKPSIDGYSWACRCGGIMRRAPEVIDAWFDSGSMPYAQWHYPFEHEAEFNAHFPADYICEAVDQTRGWFYSLLAIATTAFDSPAYRNVIVNELVLDAEGQKMSKSKGNVVDPWQVIGEFGADTVRLYLVASSQVWLPKRFDPRTIPDVAGGFLKTLRNTYNFLALYAEHRAQGEPEATQPVDRWLLEALDRVVAEVNRAWAEYDVTTGTRAIVDFVVNDLSNWYVRVNRGRFWAPDAQADPVAVAVLHKALVTVSRLLAPVVPFASDWLHRALSEHSVHLARFPVAQGAAATSTMTAMAAVRRLASLARAAREEVNLRVRQPVQRVRIAVPAQVRGPEFMAFLDLFKLEVNVKSVEIVESDTELVRLRAKPNFRSLGKRYGKETPVAAQAAGHLSPDHLRSLEGGAPVQLPVNGRTFEYLPEDVTVEREVLSDWAVQSDGPFVVALDPHLDEGLRQEGLARELVNRVQRLRKEAGYDYTTRIFLAIAGPPEVLSAASTHADFIRAETLARDLSLSGRLPQPDREQTLDIDGHTVTIGVRCLDQGAGRAPGRQQTPDTNA